MRRQFALSPTPTSSFAAPELSTRDLSAGAYLCAWSLRQWVQSAHYGRCTVCDLRRRFEEADCQSAATPCHHFMTLVARGARRRIEIRPPGERKLARDELALVRLVALSGQGHRPRFTARLARGLVHEEQRRDVVAVAGEFGSELIGAGLTLSGWPELQLVGVREAC